MASVEPTTLFTVTFPMQNIRLALLQIAQDEPRTRSVLVPLTRQAQKWESMPKGWTNESRQKFWASLTGDSKHKVTSCIEKMKDKGGIDNPGAFCASLADRVMGKEWRSKKADLTLSTASMPPVIKRVLAEMRIKKRQISVKVSTNYTMYSAGDDGNKGFTAVVDLAKGSYTITKGDWGGGGLGRSTPSPVDDVKAPRQSLQAMQAVVKGQMGGAPYASITVTDQGLALLTASKKSSLQPPRHLKRVVPDGHYQVWLSRENDPNSYIQDAPTIQVAMRKAKEATALAGVLTVVIYDSLGNHFKTVKKGSERLAELRALRGYDKQAADLKGLLARLFQGHIPYVKDGARFIMDLAGDTSEWPTSWANSGWSLNLDEVKETEFFSPSLEFTDVVDTVKITVSATLGLRKIPAVLSKHYRAHVKDPLGFTQATKDMVADPKKMNFLKSLLQNGLVESVKEDLELILEDMDVQETIQGVTDWYIKYRTTASKIGKATAKVTPAGVTISVPVIFELDVSDHEAPEQDDFDTPYQW